VILSRQNVFDRSKCVKNVGGNQFQLVILAAARARQIADEHRKSESRVHKNPAMDALLEIQSGKFG
jgi:DNA-directed RNA polymerase omega subunit